MMIKLDDPAPPRVFTQDFIDGLIRNRRRKGVDPNHQLESASALLGAPPLTNAKIADHIADFLRKRDYDVRLA